MIITEYPYNGRDDLIKFVSDENRYLIQNETGYIYEEAIDKYPSRYTYTEGEIIPEEVDMSEY